MNALPKTFTFPRPLEEIEHTLGRPESFPLEALPAVLRTVTKSMSSTYQVPHCLPAMSALAVLSGAIGKSTTLVGGHKDKTTHLNVFVFAASERGTGKGCVAERLARPIVEANELLRLKHDGALALARSRLGILKKEITKLETVCCSKTGLERDQAENELELKHRQLLESERETLNGERTTLLVQNSTSEGLAAALAASDETLFSYSAEAGASLRVCLGKYTSGTGDFDLLLSSYSVEFARLDRAGRPPVDLKAPCLSLLWLAQGCVVRELCASPEAIERGLTARCLVFETGAERQLDDRLSLRAETEEWDNLLRQVLGRRLDGQIETIQADADAREVFAKFHDESVALGRTQFQDLDGELSRWRENSIKLAGLFAVLEGAATVGPEIAIRACSLVRWCAHSYLSILSAGRSQAKAKEMSRLLEIVAEHGGAVALGELGRHHGIDRKQVEVTLAACPGRLELVKLAPSGAGRPREILRHPADKSDKSDLLPEGVNKSDKTDLSAAPC